MSEGNLLKKDDVSLPPQNKVSGIRVCDTLQQLHQEQGIKVSTPDTSSSYSFLNSEPNNNTNNNTINFEVSAFDTLIPSKNLIENKVSAQKKPIPFWILHLFSVEGKVELTSSSVIKLLKERYGINVDRKVIIYSLHRLTKRGVLRRRRPFTVHTGGHGGLRRVYYYSYVSLDKLCEAMATYDESYSLQNVKNTGEDFFREKLLEALYGILEVLTRIEAKMR